MMDAQKPLICIGSVVHIGDWTGVVSAIDRDGVILTLSNGRCFFVARQLIEDEVTE